MVVYASNQPEQFDWAINDRIDEMVEFALPTEEERLRMILMYMDQLLSNPPKNAKPIKVEGIDEGMVHSIAARTEGFSGREISKLAIAWQAAAYGHDPAVFDAVLMQEVLEDHIRNKVRSPPICFGASSTKCPLCAFEHYRQICSRNLTLCF